MNSSNKQETKVEKSAKKFTRHFHVGFYEKYKWLTGCSLWNKTQNIGLEPERKRIRINNVGDRETSYRRLYAEIFDNILQQMNCRFQNFNELKYVELCNFNISNYDLSKCSSEAFNSLKLNYGNFFDIPALKSQLSVVYETPEISDKKTPINVLNFLITTGLNKSLCEVVKLCELVLTNPATSTSVERSFSALKRIKSFIRNSTSEDRLSNLPSISIEKELVKQLSENPKLYDVIDKFAAIEDKE
ncbi:unnamed protein product [Psylliodes chrysocephalus]|uniref:HAT C-terminal dimerisation domain-containing protein n=1 Tax=Psylliodes chrysocephalus TaxID=3402493 RepID=A0A9P0D1W6_9CUCU|nr:unnamed protein product [Psylliodes chrysocephala]